MYLPLYLNNINKTYSSHAKIVLLAENRENVTNV